MDMLLNRIQKMRSGAIVCRYPPLQNLSIARSVPAEMGQKSRMIDNFVHFFLGECAADVQNLRRRDIASILSILRFFRHILFLEEMIEMSAFISFIFP
jgi:hypothetical protein